MKKYYRFAGIELEIEIDDPQMYPDDLQLTPFRTEHAENPHRYQVSVVPALEPPAGEELNSQPGIRVHGLEDGYVRYHGALERNIRNACIRGEHRGKDHRITLTKETVPGIVSARLVLNALDVEHLVASEGGVILHASYIEYEGGAILFTAPSETGKTTQAELWKKHRGAEIVNGDRAALIRDNGVLCAAGLPFSGSSPYCGNRTLPLRAVVYLNQAPKTSIRKLRGVEAFRRVWEGCCVNTWNRGDVEAASTLVETLLGQVNVYELACTPDESAVEALEQELRKQVQP